MLYVIPCDNYEFTIGNPQSAPTYTGNFPNHFDFGTDDFRASDLNHGTSIAGLIKQVAPEANIISMGVNVARRDLLAVAHMSALD